jgi:C-terminal processing protease CtpA/Prc
MSAKKSAGAEEPKDVFPRLCHLSRNDSNDKYGFTLILNRNGTHVAKNVPDGLPAAVGGLREGDHILEVNGESIDGLEHGQVRKKILAKGATTVDLLVAYNLDAYLDHRNAKQEMLTRLKEKILGMLDVNFVI